MEEFLGKHNLWKVAQEKVENFSKKMTYPKITLVTKNTPIKQRPSQDFFNIRSTKHFKELIPTSQELFQKQNRNTSQLIL